MSPWWNATTGSGGRARCVGGSPPKALLQSAAVMDTVERSSEWGIKAAGEPDWSAIQAFEDASIDKLVKGVTGLVAQRGIEVLTGTATLGPDRALTVDGAPVSATD